MGRAEGLSRPPLRLHRANALEEQLKEQELRACEMALEEARRHRELLCKMERERSIEVESLQARWGAGPQQPPRPGRGLSGNGPGFREGKTHVRNAVTLLRIRIRRQTLPDVVLSLSQSTVSPSEHQSFLRLDGSPFLLTCSYEPLKSGEVGGNRTWVCTPCRKRAVKARE